MMRLTLDGGVSATFEIAAVLFHILRLVNQVLTRCRRDTRTNTTGHRAAK